MAIQASLVLASGSATRLEMLRAVGLDPTVARIGIDESALRASMTEQGISPRDIAAELADLKAMRAAQRFADAWIIAADQVLDIDGEALGKPEDLAVAARQLRRLSGRSHQLHSAVVIYQNGRHVWRHVSSARLTMRSLTNADIAAYLARIGNDALETAGSYRIEGYGARLFQSIDGDHFTILGLPLLPLLSYLHEREVITV